MDQSNKNNAARIDSIDFIRGVVMVLMAIDHVRVYSGIPAGGQEVGIFFTRWVTHFCAPAFAFFAGTGAFLYGKRIADNSKLSSYLVTRGIILVVLEVTLIRFLWAFHLKFSEFSLAGVIWMLGWCMILLSPMVRIRPIVVSTLGLSIILLQQCFQYVPQILPVSSRESFGKWWEFIYPSGFKTFDGMAILYVIIPWIGVMAAGYGFGQLFEINKEKRKKVCLWIGLVMVSLFLIIGCGQIFMSTSIEDTRPFLLRLLNQQKYPASQLFLMMTLGPLIAVLPYLEEIKNWFGKAIMIFGRVSFFYYLLHILVIHVSALAVQFVLFRETHSEWYNYAPYVNVPEASQWSLSLLYLVFIIDVIILFFVCRWYDRYKTSHRGNKWLQYI